MSTSEKVVIPRTARKPQDHLKAVTKAKAEATGMNLSIEFTGVTYIIDREVIDDTELMELIADMQNNPVFLTKVVRSILGTDQWAKFLASNRDKKSGRVPTAPLWAIFNILDDALGKSSASPTS